MDNQEIKVFAPGDKVMVTQRGGIEWPFRNYSKVNQLKSYTIYTVDVVNYEIANLPAIQLIEDDLNLEYHPNHFTKVEDIENGQ